MKHKSIKFISKQLMKWGKYKICIVDDEKVYFNNAMIKRANEAGFFNIDRYPIVNDRLHKKFLSDYYDLIILDIKGSTEPSVAKDGLALASSLAKTTSSYIAITSAHQYQLSNRIMEADYVIENRTLTNTDFIEVLIVMVSDSLDKKIALYKKLFFRLGFSLLKQSV